MVNEHGMSEAACWDRAELERGAHEAEVARRERKRAGLEWAEYRVLPYTADAAVCQALLWAATWRRAGSRVDAERCIAWARRERSARARAGLGFDAYMAAERGR